MPDQNDYREALTDIRSMLIKSEETVIIHTWAFFTWGGLLALATILHLLLVIRGSLSVGQSLLWIWGPAFVLAATLETIAFIRKVHDEELPVMSKSMINLLLSLVGQCTGVSFLVYIMAARGLYVELPAAILTAFAIIMMSYAASSALLLNLYGYILIAASVILYLASPVLHYGILAAGTVMSIIFIAAGFHLRHDENRKDLSNG